MKKIFTLIIAISLIMIIGCNMSSKFTTTSISSEKDRLQKVKEKGVLTFDKIFSKKQKPFFKDINGLYS